MHPHTVRDAGFGTDNNSDVPSSAFLDHVHIIAFSILDSTLT